MFERKNNILNQSLLTLNIRSRVIISSIVLCCIQSHVTIFGSAYMHPSNTLLCRSNKTPIKVQSLIKNITRTPQFQKPLHSFHQDLKANPELLTNIVNIPAPPPKPEPKKKRVVQALKTPPILPSTHFKRIEPKVTPPIVLEYIPPLEPKVTPPTVLAYIPPPPVVPEKKPIQKVPVSDQPSSSKAAEKKVSFYEPLSDTIYKALEDFKKLYAEYVVIDTEATGLGHGQTITEIAAVKMRHFQQTGLFFQTHLNPNRPVTKTAEDITGYTWESLKNSPQFTDIQKRFLAFIGRSPLVFHNAHFDCKLINESARLKTPNFTDLHKTNAIIDTQVLANEMFPNKRNSLRNLALKFHIESLLDSQFHGALSDAVQLVGVLKELFRINDSKFYSKHPINWSLVKEIDLVDEFESVMSTPAESFFRSLGLVCNIPEAFRYSPNMYHSETGDNMPAMVSVMKTFEGETKGYYIRFFSVTQEAMPRFKSMRDRYVFGTEENATISIHEGGQGTLCIGTVFGALHINEFINQQKIIPTSILPFVGSGGLTVKAISHILHLPTLQLPKSTKVVFVVLSTQGAKLKDSDKKGLSAFIERYAHPQFFSLLILADKFESFCGFTVKYKQNDWQVESDVSIGSLRQLKLIRSYEPAVFLDVNLETKTIHENEDLIENPNSMVLVAEAPVQLKVIRIDISDFPKGTNLSPEERTKILSNRLAQNWPLKTIRDIQFIETCEEAKIDYEKALIIDENCAVSKYFKQRGITSTLPEAFRYMTSVFHPGIEKKLPATLIPLFNEDGILVGVHRIFCGENGERLAKQNKLPPKLSLGRTVNAAFEIYKSDASPNVVLISEGFENGLVARDAISACLKSKEKKDLFNKKFKVETGFSIKSCVGINGLVDIPFSTYTRTIVILADNDGLNQDVKRTMKQTVGLFLKRGFTIFMAMPKSKLNNPKPDLNDIYFEDGRQKPDAVFATILEAVQIHDVADIGEDNISIESALFNLKKPSQNPFTIRNDLDSQMWSILRQTQKKWIITPRLGLFKD